MGQSALETVAKNAQAEALRTRAADLLASSTARKIDVDATLLGYVLERTGITLANETSRSLEEEVEEWDRSHLGDLVYSLPSLQRSSPRADEKLRFLIQQSMRGSLISALADPSLSSFGAYNAHFLDGLDKAGFNVNEWLSHGGNMQLSSTLPSDDPRRHTEGDQPAPQRSFRFIEWTRDFRREFAIGNYSTCCIAVGESQKLRYQHVLLDYFLDLAIKAIMINERDGDLWQPAGQHYLVPCTTGGDDKQRILAITATELATPKYRGQGPGRGQTRIVPALVAPFEGSSGFTERYGADATFVGGRFSEYEAYVRLLREAAGNLSGNLRATKSQINDIYRKIRPLIMNPAPGEDLGPEQHQAFEQIRERRRDIDAVTSALTKSRDSVCDGQRLSLRKVGLHSAITQGLPYTGTDYLDLYVLSDNEGRGVPFRSETIPKTIPGHLLATGELRGLAETVYVARDQYIGPRKRRR